MTPTTHPADSKPADSKPADAKTADEIDGDLDVQETNWLDLPSVVVATTGGRESDVAILAAHQWAKAQRTRLVVYHSVVGHAVASGVERNAHRRRITEGLASHTQLLTRRRPRQFKVVVDSAPVAVGILRCAAMHNAGLVVLGPSGGTPEGIGSRVLRRARFPMMVARSSAAVRRMLVVTELSASSTQAVEAARRFARPLRARLTMLHAAQGPDLDGAVGPRLAAMAQDSGAEPILARGCPVRAVEAALQAQDAAVVVVNASAWPLDGNPAAHGRRLLATAAASSILWAPGPAAATTTH
jgi:hypothetical protein